MQVYFNANTPASGKADSTAIRDVVYPESLINGYPVASLAALVSGWP